MKLHHITLSSPEGNNTFFFQIHYFTSSFSDQKYQQYKKEFIEFSEQKKNEIEAINNQKGNTPSFIVVGIEELPIEIESEYKVTLYYRIVKQKIPGDAIFTVIGDADIPDEFKEKIINYRKHYISIDYDNANVLELCHELLEKYHDIKVYKTANGYHFYVPHKWETFGENFNVRKQYGDDEMRLKLDKIYVKSGVPYLTNTLFKKRFQDGVRLQATNNISEEKEISPKDIKYTLGKLAKYYLVEFDEVINGIRVMRDKDTDFKVWATADATVIKSASELDQFLTNFVENEYKKYVNIDKLVKEVYSKLIRKYGVQIQWERKGDRLFIYAPEKEIGKVIGKGGKNVKDIEKISGLKVKVMPLEKEAQEREQKKNEVVNRILSIMRDIDFV